MQLFLFLLIQYCNDDSTPLEEWEKDESQWLSNICHKEFKYLRFLSPGFRFRHLSVDEVIGPSMLFQKISDLPLIFCYRDRDQGIEGLKDQSVDLEQRNDFINDVQLWVANF